MTCHQTSLGPLTLQILHIRLQTDCSAFNIYLLNNNTAFSLLRQPGDDETISHFFWNCPLFRYYQLTLSLAITVAEVKSTIFPAFVNILSMPRVFNIIKFEVRSSFPPSSIELWLILFLKLFSLTAIGLKTVISYVCVYNRNNAVVVRTSCMYYMKSWSSW